MAETEAKDDNKIATIITVFGLLLLLYCSFENNKFVYLDGCRIIKYFGHRYCLPKRKQNSPRRTKIKKLFPRTKFSLIEIVLQKNVILFHWPNVVIFNLRNAINAQDQRH